MAIPKDVTDALNNMRGFAATHPAFSTRGLNALTQHIAEQDAETARLRKHLADANRGAETNSRVNQLLADDLLNAKAQIQRVLQIEGGHVRADLAAEREQEAQVVSTLCITLVGKPVGVHGTRESIEALDAYLSNHVAMVAKLRQISVDMANSYDDAGDCLDFSDQLDAILSAEPAPPAPVDIATVREVIAALIRSGYQRENHLAVKLSVAIGDTK